MLDVIVDTLVDGLKLVPFLFGAFLLIELFEHKFNSKSKNIVSKSGKLGPVFGSLIGCFPQCGFSVMATNLYVTRIISLGTLISIYLSTSDEMLPILISEKAPFQLIFKVLILKVIFGFIWGIIIDFALRKQKKEKQNYSICNEEHCHCDEGLIKSTVIHTLKTLLFILFTTFVLNVLMYYVGEETLSRILLKENIFGSFITSLIGLIPNCGASVIITELFLNGAISFGAMIAGLLTGSGVALIILFRENNDIKENLKIIFLLYIIGIISGFIVEIINMII